MPSVAICNERTEPSCTFVGVAAAGRQSARSDIDVTLRPPYWSLICMIYLAAQTRGTAAALRDRSKYRVHVGRMHPGHTNVPSSASERSLAVTREPLLARAHRELSVALVQSQGCVYHSCSRLLAKAAGWQALPGADTTFLDLGFCCNCGACLSSVPFSSVSV
jgi:hypothetical protein